MHKLTGDWFKGFKTTTYDCSCAFSVCLQTIKAHYVFNLITYAYVICEISVLKKFNRNNLAWSYRHWIWNQALMLLMRDIREIVAGICVKLTVGDDGNWVF